jgi:hypothetical protein
MSLVMIQQSAKRLFSVMSQDVTTHIDRAPTGAIRIPSWIPRADQHAGDSDTLFGIWNKIFWAAFSNLQALKGSFAP